jgi:hypothetical protein
MATWLLGGLRNGVTDANEGAQLEPSSVTIPEFNHPQAAARDISIKDFK